MSTKFIQGLTDDPQVEKEMQKQIGCMAGFLQLFDRHQIITGKRLYSQKRLVASRRPSSATDPTVPLSADLNEATQNVQEIAVESLGRETQDKEAKPSQQCYASKGSSIQQSRCSVEASRFSLDIRDVVRDSFSREVPKDLRIQSNKPQSLACNSAAAKENNKPPSTEKTQPRRDEDTKKPNFPRREASAFSNECRDIPIASIFEYRDALRSSIRVREPPRLSLDSRAYIDRRSRMYCDELQNHGANVGDPSRKSCQRDEDEKRGSPSVVARLMGLEAMPQSPSLSQSRAELRRSASESRICYDSFKFKYNEDGSVSKVNSDNNLQNKAPRQHDNAKTKKTYQDSPNSGGKQQRYPNEAAPWSHQNNMYERWNSFPEQQKGKNNVTNNAEALYAEIEKKLRQKGLKETDRDIEALKQVLEAVQLRSLMHSDKDKPRYHHPIPNKQSQSVKHDHPSKMILNEARVLSKPRTVQTKSMKSMDVSIAAMRPPKPPRPSEKNNRKEGCVSRNSPSKMLGHSRSNNLGKFSNDVSPSATRYKEPNSPSRRPRSLSASPTRTTSPARSSVSPSKERITEKAKNLVKEKESRRPNSGVTSPRTARNLNNRNLDRVQKSPGNRTEWRLLQTEDAELNSMASNLSESSRSNFSHMDLEKLALTSMKEDENWEAESKYIARQDSDCSERSLVAPETPEQPSPVSVLDPLLYKDDGSPPPIVKRSITFSEAETIACENFAADNWNHQGYSERCCHLNTEDSTLILAGEKIQRHNVDFNSRADNDKLEYLFITDILMVSGLLEETKSHTITFHSSDCPIDPHIFLVVQKDYSNASVSKQQKHESMKINLQAIFDVVNDILSKKLSPYLQSHMASKLWLRRPTGQQLLREVWEEFQSISRLHSEDVYEHLCMIIQKDISEKSYTWSDTKGELPGMVLDIERMIFKDLIDETISDLGIFSSRHKGPSSVCVPRRKLEYA